MVCFESVKWPRHYIHYHSRFIDCCYFDGKPCTTIHGDTMFINHPLYDSLLCTECAGGPLGVSKPQQCKYWIASIFDENAIVPPKEGQNYRRG